MIPKQSLSTNPAQLQRVQSGMVPTQQLQQHLDYMAQETIPFGDKKAMDDITHSLEKELRPTLRKISTDFDNRNIWIDVTSDGRLKLNVSRPANATAAELARFKRLEEIAQAKFRALVNSTDPNVLRGFRAYDSPR